MLPSGKNLRHCVTLQAKESFAADQPSTVRILKHLLTVQGDRDMQAALDDAFAPGTPLQTGESDYLSTYDLAALLLISKP